MPDQEFKLLITGDASSAVAASQQAGDATRKLKVDTSDLSDETKRSLGLMQPLKDELKNTGKAAEESGLAHRELRRVLFDIGNVAAPGAGAALGELAFGPVGAALALAGAYEAVQKKIDAISEELDKLEITEFTAHQAAIDSVRKAWSDAKLALDKYFEEVKNAGQDKDPFATHLERIKAVSAAQTEANIKALEEQQKITIEWMKTHGFSPAQIAAQEETNRKQIQAVQNAGAQKSIADTEADITARTKAQKGFDDAVVAAKARSDKAKTNQEKANRLQENATATPEEIKKENDRIAELEGKMIPGATGQAGLSDAAWAELQQLKQTQATRAAQLAQAKKEADAATAEKAAADAALSQAQQKGLENKNKITEETEQVTTAKAVEGVKESGQQNVNSIKDFGQARSIADQFLSGKPITADQAQYLIIIEQAITGQKQTLGSAAKLIEMQSANQGVMASLLEKHQSQIITVQRRLDQLNARMNQVHFNTK